MARLLNPILIGRPETEGLRHWSPTGLEATLECPRRRYLNKKFKKKLTWPDFAKGTHMHRKIEELRTNHLRPSLEKNSRYNSAEAFANVVANDWQRGSIKEGKIRGDKIIWENEKQPYIIREEIRKICQRIYPVLMERQEKTSPIIFKKITKNNKINYKTSYDFELTYHGRGFSGEIDEIRREDDKIIIRDYKTGKWKYVEDKLNYAFQPTEYGFIICLLSLKDEEFRKSLGVTKEQAEIWIKKPESMSDHVLFEYFMLDLPQEWNKEKKEYAIIEKNPIIKVERKNSHYKELCRNIDIRNVMLSDMEDQRFYPPFRGRHCERCFYQKECDEMTEKDDVNIKQTTLPEYLNEKPKRFIEINQNPEKPEIKQTEFDFMKKVKKSVRKDK